MMKRLIADYCGVSYEAAFAGWVAEVEWEVDWTCDVVPRDGAKQEGLRYDNLEFSDVSKFVGGKICHELRVGDEVAFPEAPPPAIGFGGGGGGGGFGFGGMQAQLPAMGFSFGGGFGFGGVQSADDKLPKGVCTISRVPAPLL
jgi:hypothetical protein